jgi:hypothetical protein
MILNTEFPAAEMYGVKMLNGRKQVTYETKLWIMVREGKLNSSKCYNAVVCWHGPDAVINTVYN